MGNKTSEPLIPLGTDKWHSRIILTIYFYDSIVSDVGLLRDIIYLIYILQTLKDRNCSKAINTTHKTCQICFSSDLLYIKAQAHQKFCISSKRTFGPDTSQRTWHQLRSFYIRLCHPKNFQHVTYMMVVMVGGVMAWVMCFVCFGRFCVSVFRMRLMMLWRMLMVMSMIIQINLMMGAPANMNLMW